MITGAALLAASGCASIVPYPQVAADTSVSPTLAWQRVLQENVNDVGQINFAHLRDHPESLFQFLNTIGDYSPRSNPALFPDRDSQIAYSLNSYNALAMYNVIQSGIPVKLSGHEILKFFELRRFKIGTEYLTLYRYENEVIRPMGEERVHFALNCMARGCPRLPRVPFTSIDLNQQLEDQTRFFLNEERNVQVDDVHRKVAVSSILKFYTKDFLKKAPSLIAYINRYRKSPIPPDYEVGFILYDWTINRQP